MVHSLSIVYIFSSHIGKKLAHIHILFPLLPLLIHPLWLNGIWIMTASIISLILPASATLHDLVFPTLEPPFRSVPLPVVVPFMSSSFSLMLCPNYSSQWQCPPLCQLIFIISRLILKCSSFRKPKLMNLTPCCLLYFFAFPSLHMI